MAVDISNQIHLILDDIRVDDDFASDLACDLVDRKGEDLFVRALYHKARRRGLPVERENNRRDLVLDGQVIEAKVFTPWTVLRTSSGKKDRSFDDFAHSKDLANLKSGAADWLLAIVVHPLDRAHSRYPTRSHPGIIDPEDFDSRMIGEADRWAQRNGVTVRHRFPLLIADTVEHSNTGRVMVLLFLFAASTS